MRLSAGLVRGRIYYADLGHGEKPWLVVSNNGRNSRLGNASVVRITMSEKPPLASIVVLVAGEPVVGRVLCDDVTELFPDEVKRDGGALSTEAMIKVAAGLRSAFAL
jgi:mRNA interferase MazF